MPEAEGRVETGAEGTPVLPFEERIKSLIEPSDEGKTADITNSSLIRLANLALQTRNQTPDHLADLLKRGDDWFADGRVPEEEWPRLAGEIQAEIEKLRIKAAEAEPEIKKLERPKTAEEAVKVFLTEIFDLHERGLREGKSWEKTGELFSEYTTLQRWVEDVYPKGREDEFKGVKNEALSTALEREYPQGVFLKEKLTLFLETMKRLHNRQIEVIKAEGGLEDLGVGKVGEAAAPILKTPLTNIRPIDWFLLAHIDELFPESKSPETKIDLEVAWATWQGIGSHPYLDEQEDDKWKPRKIEIGEWQSPYQLEDLFQSGAVMAEVRHQITRHIGGVAGTRAESLAHSILTVGLTFDMWDRERWKQKGRNDARDLMWFEWKRVERFKEGRPAGPEDTIGCYWAEKRQDERNKKTGSLSTLAVERLGNKEAKRRIDLLTKNKNRRIFLTSPPQLSKGTLIGDFWHSTTIPEIKREKDKKTGEEERFVFFRTLSYYHSLKEIPWLDPQRFEEEVYEGYFTYSMLFAAKIEDAINKLEWDPEKQLKNRDFWVGLTDTTLRLGHFCPWIMPVTEEKNIANITKDDADQKKKETDDHVGEFRRLLARGMFWTGSYLAQPHPEKLLSAGRFSRNEVYGDSFVGIKFEPGILDAIEASGYLDEKGLKELRKEIWEFNFHMKGRK